MPGTLGGLAHAVASGASTRGGQVIEVVCQGAAAPWPNPDHVQRFAEVDLHQRYEVATVHQRQALLLDQADAVVALPGGPAMLWELLGGIALAHLAQHSKPLALLNVADWFTPLLGLLTHLRQTGLVRAHLKHSLLVETDPWSLVQRLLTHPRWPSHYQVFDDDYFCR